MPEYLPRVFTTYEITQNVLRLRTDKARALIHKSQITFATYDASNSTKVVVSVTAATGETGAVHFPNETAALQYWDALIALLNKT